MIPTFGGVLFSDGGLVCRLHVVSNVVRSNVTRCKNLLSLYKFLYSYIVLSNSKSFVGSIEVVSLFCSCLIQILPAYLRSLRFPRS